MFSGFDIRGRFGDTLTVEYVWNVGKALADWLPTDGSVVVVSSPTANSGVVKAIIEGVRLQGRNVIDGGQGDKATLIHVAGSSQAAGGVLIGHDDLENLETIELFQDEMAPVTSDTGLMQIAALVEAGNFVPAAVKGDLTSII
jgi:phosphomannomutase